jgi:protein-disulfide isomerase
MAMLRVPVGPDDHIRGNPNAPVTLVEYGDFECPHCGAAHPVVLAVEEHFGDDLRFVYRHFPLTQIHPNAEPAAEASEYAGSYGRFWEMHDAIFENQDQLGLPLLFAIVQALGLSQEGLRDALVRQLYAPKVLRDFMGGVRSGVNGTPTFFINGRRHDAPFAYEYLVSAIEAELAHASA